MSERTARYIPDDTVFIPYTGATSDVNLGSKNLLTEGDITTGATNGKVINLKQSLGISIDGVTEVITTGFKGYLTVPYDCTLTGWTLLSADESATAGAIQIDVWKDTYANFPPTNADTITNGHEPAIAASSSKAVDTDLSDWTTVTLTKGDVLGFNVDSCTSITKAVLSFDVIRR